MSKVPYVQLVRSLMYAMVCARLDITHVVRVVCQYMSNPQREHQVAVKWILRYLKDTSSMCLRFSSGNPVLESFIDSDMPANIDRQCCRIPSSVSSSAFARNTNHLQTHSLLSNSGYRPFSEFLWPNKTWACSSLPALPVPHPQPISSSFRL